MDGAEIYYEEKGHRDRPALVFLHGGIGTIEDFNPILSRLKGGFRLIGIDSRGHGRSTLGSLPLTYERLQKDVEAVIKHLRLSELSVVGFSDGGIVGYRLAAQMGVRLRKLATISAAFELKEDAPVREIFAKVTGESWRKKFPETYSVYQKLNPQPDFDGFVAASVKMWLDSSPGGYPAASVERIRSPLLLIRGDEDHLVPLETMVALTQRVKGIRFSNVAFASHVAFVDQPDVVVSALNRFFED